MTNVGANGDKIAASSSSLERAREKNSPIYARLLNKRRRRGGAGAGEGGAGGEGAEGQRSQQRLAD